jgi:hypothetical protein
MKKIDRVGKLHLEYIMICIIMILLAIPQAQFQQITKNHVPPITASQEVIWDSTHTISSPHDELLLQNLLFQENWMYDFSLEVITPHECEINMTLSDPEGCVYNLFQGTVAQQQKEIQFGMVNEGACNITLEVIAEFTWNLHLKIERTLNFIDLFEQDNDTLSFSSFRFSENEPLREISILLDPTNSYTFIIALVSPLINISPLLNTFIEDPINNHFIIYQNQEVNEFYLTFQFQTINHGIHKLQLSINIVESCFNIIVIVMRDNSGSPINNDPLPQNTLHVPLEIQVVSMGVFIFAILLAFLMKKSSRNELIY